jgi:hypothetical protein
MQVPYKFQKCILCLANAPGDWEHIIPKSIGGRLQAKTLCNSCNQNLGSELIGNLKLTAEIRLAMENLKNELPALYSELLDKAAFIGNAPDSSTIQISKNKKKELRVIPTKGVNGSFIQDTREAKVALDKILARNKVNQTESNSLKGLFADLEDDKPLSIPGGYTFIKRSIPPLRPKLTTSDTINDRLPVLIAFEFLALLIGNLILEEMFLGIAKYIQYGIPSDRVSVEKFAGGNKYDTFHAIKIEPQDNSILFHIRLFRWITFVVTFHNLQYQGVDSVYFEDIKSQKSLYAKTQKDAYQGMWYELP